MFAIIVSGAKQFKVSAGDIIETEKIKSEPGKDFNFDEVLLISDGEKVNIGQPFIKDANVRAEVLAEVKGEKEISFKYRRRKTWRWKKGHRQQRTRLKIKEING